MSRSKQLKELPENNINLYKLFSLFSFEKKSKYTEMLLRLMKRTPHLDEACNDVKNTLKSEFDFVDSDFDEIGKIELLLYYKILESMFNFSDLKSFQKFCLFNERNLIQQNDLSKYNSFEQILQQLSVAELISDSKDLEKQIIKIYEDEIWLLVRPLTFESSKKYGSNTKWCTTTENNPDYFFKYSKKGVLIYCINKKSGYKVASFYSLDKNDPEFSFWDQKDSRIDSLATELTNDLRDIIFKESTNKDAKTNRFLLKDDERIKEEENIKNEFKGYYENGIVPITSSLTTTTIATEAHTTMTNTNINFQ